MKEFLGIELGSTRIKAVIIDEGGAAVDTDSRLGWLCSSGYTGGRAQIEWKLRKMRELYGDEVSGR